jgi:hypothetical protein
MRGKISNYLELQVGGHLIVIVGQIIHQTLRWWQENLYRCISQVGTLSDFVKWKSHLVEPSARALQASGLLRGTVIPSRSFDVLLVLKSCRGVFSLDTDPPCASQFLPSSIRVFKGFSDRGEHVRLWTTREGAPPHRTQGQFVDFPFA